MLLTVLLRPARGGNKRNLDHAHEIARRSDKPKRFPVSAQLLPVLHF
jgi:hypothetical protein